ncbi:MULTISPECIES: hypothetical protein [Nocardia]|uniref:hypothetical protein n=1 Tax=Nocardia TaxID=1817 RepID=UPI00130040FA|nr:MULTISPECIES: hypothetical protein [Nocardia]
MSHSNRSHARASVLSARRNKNSRRVQRRAQRRDRAVTEVEAAFAALENDPTQEGNPT